LGLIFADLKHHRVWALTQQILVYTESSSFSSLQCFGTRMSI